tara:strand:- start:78 stop:341 length:264 start_codon:yes stop_codon:yes gene_type:complete
MNLFAKVPLSIIEQNKPEHLQMFCSLYLMEFRKLNYSLKEEAAKSNLSYRQCRTLQALAKKTIKSTKSTKEDKITKKHNQNKTPKRK